MWNRYLIKNQNFEVSPSRQVESFIEEIREVQNNIQPQNDVDRNCVMMMVLNSAKPDWFTVPCNKELPLYVICTKQVVQMTGNKAILKQKKFCGLGGLLISNKCFSFPLSLISGK